MKTISACLIIKNEEDNLPRLLNELDQCCDEINIYDTGSTDKSEEICKLFNGKNVINFVKGEWRDDFGWARNQSFSLATKDYILWIDADNSITNELINTINQLKENDFYDVDVISVYQKNNWFVNIKHFILNREINPRWIYPIHEELCWDDDKKTKIMPFDKASNNILDLQSINIESLTKKIIRNYNIYKICFDKNYKFDAVMWYHYGKTIDFLKNVNSDINLSYPSGKYAFEQAISTTNIDKIYGNLIFLLSAKKLANIYFNKNDYEKSLFYAKLASCATLIPRNDVSKLIADSYFNLNNIPDNIKYEESLLWNRNVLNYWISLDEISLNMNCENLNEIGEGLDDITLNALLEICKLSIALGNTAEEIKYYELLKLKFPNNEYVKHMNNEYKFLKNE